jgi:hypothetical protein
MTISFGGWDRAASLSAECAAGRDDRRFRFSAGAGEIVADKARAPYTLTAALAVLMVTQSMLGLIFQREYRDVEWIRATWFGNDWMTLVVAVPLLISGLLMKRRGSAQGMLLWLGVIAYAVYNYAFYLLGAALNAFFPLYVLALVLSVVTLSVGLARLDVADVAASCA